jgi:hypothetical protein
MLITEKLALRKLNQLQELRESRNKLQSPFKNLLKKMRPNVEPRAQAFVWWAVGMAVPRKEALRLWPGWSPVCGEPMALILLMIFGYPF